MDCWDTYVDVKKYKNVSEGCGSLTFYSLLNRSILAGFGSVFITAAMFEHTAIYKLWSKAGVRFVEDEEFAGKLQYRRAQNGALVTIYYAHRVSMV